MMASFLHYPFWYGKDCADLQTTLEQIHREFSSPGPAAAVMLQALFMQFFVKILRNYEPASNAAITYIPIPLIKSYILIEDSFLLEYDTITLKELSSRLGLSPRQTSRILFNRYGRIFFKKGRKHAWLPPEHLFKRKSASISEIASRLGIFLPQSFSCRF